MKRIEPDGRDETPLERVDRSLTELLAELRLAFPGVTVLLAFLLILPFNKRFALVTPFEKTVYMITLLCAAICAIVLVAPIVHHRLLFRHNVKEKLLFSSNRLALVGLTFMALSITGAILLITSFVYGMPECAIFTAATAVAFALLWVVLPLVALRRAD